MCLIDVPTTNRWYAKWKLSWNMYALNTRFCTLGADLYAQSVLTNKISLSELTRKFVKSALLVGITRMWDEKKISKVRLKHVVCDVEEVLFFPSPPLSSYKEFAEDEVFFFQRPLTYDDSGGTIQTFSFQAEKKDRFFLVIWDRATTWRGGRGGGRGGEGGGQKEKKSFSFCCCSTCYIISIYFVLSKKYMGKVTQQRRQILSAALDPTGLPGWAMPHSHFLGCVI